MRALRLFIRMTVYYAVIVALVMIALRIYPHMQDYLPIGGVKELLTQPDANPLKGSASIRGEAVNNFGESLFWLTVAKDAVAKEGAGPDDKWITETYSSAFAQASEDERVLAHSYLEGWMRKRR